MTHQILAEALSFDPVDDEGKPTGAAPEVLKRGDVVPDYVSPFLITALTSAGYIAYVGEEPDPRIAPFEAAPAVVRTPEQPPVLPNDAGSEPPATRGRVTGAASEKPKATDGKQAWEDYAASSAVGVPRAEAESMSKPDLIREVNRRESEKGKAPNGGTTP